jgi:hypothetical protein
MKPEVTSAVLSSPVVTEESSGVEFVEMTKPKQEPVEYETEVEEVDRLQNRDDPLVQLLGGESSQTLQDSSQGLCYDKIFSLISDECTPFEM